MGPGHSRLQLELSELLKIVDYRWGCSFNVEVFGKNFLSRKWANATHDQVQQTASGF